MTTAVLMFLVAHPPVQGAAMGASLSGPLDPSGLYPYQSKEFGRFVNDSFGGSSGADKFYTWLDSAIAHSGFKYPDKKPHQYAQWLDEEQKTISEAKNPTDRAKKERIAAVWIHRMIKKTMPHFDLDYGFEFKNAVTRGQRQCFLQSVLVAGSLQRAGVRAGVTMVNRNILGQETNNKHAICLLRMSNGEDVIVHDSEDYAFAKQQGLFLDSTSGYKFVKPVYDGDFAIKSYQSYTGGATIPISAVRPMPRSFIASQFDYYRGERTNGSVMAQQKTPSGLTAATGYFTKSISEDPNNSLSQYMLGRVYMYRNMNEQAARSLDQAMKLYDRQGWIPPDERMAQAKAHKYS